MISFRTRNKELMSWTWLWSCWSWLETWLGTFIRWFIHRKQKLALRATTRQASCSHLWTNCTLLPYMYNMNRTNHDDQRGEKDWGQKVFSIVSSTCLIGQKAYEVIRMSINNTLQVQTHICTLKEPIYLYTCMLGFKTFIVKDHQWGSTDS